MTKPKPIDWRAVAEARRELDRLRREHPELSGPSDTSDWIASLKENTTMADTQQAAFRLPIDLLKRLDRHVKRLQEASPGMNVSRTDAVRLLLTSGLDQAEEQAGRRKKAP